MKFGSVCSGIEAASVAWTLLGWKAQWLAEIEPFPCALLKHHYPDTPNLGDMTRYKEWPTDDKHAIDLLCGGTPCQSFSVAGLRKGLDDPRGNLMLTFGAIAAKYRPQWLVWENVPGVLSSNGGADFGAFLGMLGQLGYGFAYRVLDAQYFGVAQRRRRVFVVGCLGDWRSAAAVLFERHSLQGHPAPSRQAGQAVTPTIRAGAANGGAGHGARSGDSKDELIVPVAKTLRGQPNASNRDDTDTDTYIPVPHAAISPALKARDHKGVSSDGDGDGAILVPMSVALRGRDGGATAELGDELAFSLRASSGGGDKPHVQAFNTTHTLRGEGFDASEDGTGRGTPLVPVALSIMPMNSGNQGGDFIVQPVAYRTAGDGAVFEEGDRTAPLTTGTDPCANILAFDTTQVTSVANRSNPKAGDPCHPLAAGAHVPAIAFDSRMRGAEPAVGREERPPQTMVERTGAIDATKPWNVAAGMAVRRLTPRECERLQGFPDDYTAIPRRNKPAADGPRYKALGNSWAVPNVRWIGERINAVALVNSEQQAIKVRAA